MKKSTSQSAFFNPRVLIGFALCSFGVLLVLAGYSAPYYNTGGDGNTTNGFDALHKNTIGVGNAIAAIQSSRTWQSVSSMSMRRTHVAAASGLDGVYAMGGDTDRYVCSWGCGVTASVERYSSKTDSWSAVAPMNKARDYFAAATGSDGRVYAIGGWTPDGDVTDTAEVYSPDTDSWAFIAAMPVRVAMEGATAGHDGRIYVLGGGPVMNQPTQTVLIYDPATNTWSYGPPMLEPLNLLGAATGADGRIYAIASNPEVYDPSSGVWSFIAPLPTARFYLAGAADRDGRIYALGGCCAPGALQEVDIYSPATNSWVAGPTMLVQRSTPGAAFDGDGRLYAVGGSDDTFNLRSAEALDVGGASSASVPLINQPLVPDAVAPGGAGFTLTVNGTGFVSGSVVNWNGSARTTTFVSNSQLTATILASDIAAASTASVTVVSPSPGGGISNIIFFPITVPSSSVSLSSLDYQTGSAPDSVEVGDLNGDGNLDLALANFFGNTISILLGNGDGTFQRHVDYATGTDPSLNVIRDFNQDGNLDLAVRNDGNAIGIFLGNGDGTFQPATNFATGNGDIYLTAGDFDGDGELDLAATSSADNTVSVLLGNGDGTFQTHVDYQTGVAPYGVATGDVNGDGKLDLVSTSINDTYVSVLLGNGDGTFQTHVDYMVGSGPAYVTLGDFNGDGKLDLAVANYSGSTISILLGNGDGTFQRHVDYLAAYNPTTVTSGDLNGDGKLDLASADRFGQTVSILLGNGDGTFQPPINFFGSDPTYVSLADFDKNGRLDLAVANFGQNTVSIFLQTATVTLSDTSLSFGLQLVGTHSSAQTVALTNTGPITLKISSITASGDFLQRNNCGSSLPPGASCDIQVAFSPTEKGRQTGTLTITDNAPDSPQMVALIGTGTVVQLTPSSLDFGNQRVGTISRPRTVTLTNIGDTPLDIRGIAIVGPNFGDFVETTTCGSSVPAHTSCEIDVRFAPSDTGPREASLKIRDDGGGGTQDVKLRGTGVSN